MIWLYRILYWPLFIVLLPHYLWRLWRRGGKWRIAERFGYIEPPAKRVGVQRIWIQAVSVGELNALRPLLTELKANPAVEVVLSVTTTTARKLAEEKFKNFYAYLFTFPLDNFSARTWKRLQADKLILMEGELWPELLYQAGKCKAPVYLINARLSDRSFRRMCAIKVAAKWLLKKVSLILAATKQDAERYLSLGANPELVAQTGSLKFDAAMPKALDESQRKELLATLGFAATDTIILGSSTWAGEEEALLKAYAGLKENFKNLKLLIVPRHAERRDEILPVLKKSGLNFHQRSLGPVTGSPEVVLADTTGELSSLVQLADIVFVGKSLKPHKEGQTPIEPAAAGKPVLMGYGMSNFRQIAGSLVEAKGGRFVGGPAELKEQIGYLLGHPEERNQTGAQAREWYEKNRGATQKTLEWLGLHDRSGQFAEREV